MGHNPIPDLSDVRVLFLGNYADPNKLPDPQNPNAISRRMYHAEIRDILGSFCGQVISSSDPEILFQVTDEYDFVFSLFNRMRFRSSELFVSAVCEYLRKPYLGAHPEVRGLAEDKYLFKSVLNGCSIPCPKGLSYSPGDRLAPPSNLPAPYFVKPRNGANSKHISADSICSDWDSAKQQIEDLHNIGLSALVEEFCEGINLTVPVLVEDDNPIVFDTIEPVSSDYGGILSSAIKDQKKKKMEYRVLEHRGLDARIKEHISNLYEVLRPVDYFRADYRYNPETDRLNMLEINVSCDISSISSFAFAVENRGVSHPELIKRILRSSLSRQKKT